MRAIRLKVVADDRTSPSPAPAPVADAALLEVQQRIYPRAVTGLFARWRWAMVWITQAVFYGLPWLTWNGRPAVLFELGARRFYLFGVVLYPQDFIYLTALLIICAMALFLFTSVAGRLWCGYACPQTVYTEIFMWIERRIEGDRHRRMKLDAARWSMAKLYRKAAKHAAWIAVALWTGISFVGYFTPIRELLGATATATVGAWEAWWVLFYAFATYGNAGFMREQVCKYMCPYARFQGSMIDANTLVISYDTARGEPRGSRSRKADPKAMGLGSCVDCTLCVEVCPTGIDIRDGLQNECIGCAACVDVCDQVMGKMGYERGLIRYATANGLAKRWPVAQMLRQALRPRVVAYAVVLLGVTAALFTHLALRVPLKVDVLRDRGALAREVDAGRIENVYRLQIINTAEQARSFRISVAGIEGAAIASDARVDVDAAAHRMVPVRVQVDAGRAAAGANRLVFVIEALDDPTVAVREKSTFYLPSR